MQLPAPDASASNGKFNPWLKAKDLPKTGTVKLTLTGKVREASSQFGDGVTTELKMGGKLYDLTIKFSSGNYRVAFERFGSNPAKWKGAVTAKRDKYLGNEYVKFVD